jgi:hypothetical protein
LNDGLLTNEERRTTRTDTVEQTPRTAWGFSGRKRPVVLMLNAAYRAVNCTCAYPLGACLSIDSAGPLATMVVQAARCAGEAATTYLSVYPKGLPEVVEQRLHFSLRRPWRRSVFYQWCTAAQTYYLSLLTPLDNSTRVPPRNTLSGERRLKAHAYHIVPRGQVSLQQVFEHIEGVSLRQRLKVVSGVPMRLEFCAKQGRYWLLDFTLIRRKGPGRASPTTPVVDFDLAEDEGFGEETAAVYNPSTGFMVLQYNHFGPRQPRIQSYLYRHGLVVAGHAEQEELPGGQFGFDLHPVLTIEAADRLENLGIVKTISASFRVPGILARPEARRRSLSGLLDMPLMGGAQTVQFQISAGRGKEASLAPSRVKQAVRDLLSVREEITALSIVAKENEDAPREPIDFLDARLEAEVTVPLVGRRYPRAERLAALRQTFETWSQDRQLDV